MYWNNTERNQTQSLCCCNTYSGIEDPHRRHLHYLRLHHRHRHLGELGTKGHKEN